MDEKTPMEIEKDKRELFAKAAEDAEKAESGEQIANAGDADAEKEKNPESADEKQDPTQTPADGDKTPEKNAEVKVETDANADGVADKDEMPVEMARKYSDKWKSADAEFKAELKRIFANNQQTITRFKTKNKTLEDAISVANPEIYEDVKNFGITKEQSIKNRLALVSRFQRNPDETIIGTIAGGEIKLHNPAGVIRAIARATKVDLETLTKVDPQVAVLEDRNAAYEARNRAAEAQKRAEQIAQSTQAENELAEAAQAFVARHPEIKLNPEFNTRMDIAAQNIVKAEPNISTDELFERAYAIVSGLNTQQPQTKVIPKKPTVSITGSDDAGERTTVKTINSSDPNERRKLFMRLAQETGFAAK